MKPDAPKPEPKPSGVKPPPRPPQNTTVGLGPEDDHPDKKLPVTITKGAEGEGKFVRPSGGVSHHGHVIVRVEPNGRGEGVIISSEVSDSAIPRRYIKPVTETIREALGYGYDDRPVADVIVRVVGGSWDEHASSEVAYRMASIFAVKDAIKKAGPVTLK